MSRLLFFIAGAVSVGAVVGVLALAGAFDDDSEPASRSATTPQPTTQPSGAALDVAALYERVAQGVVFVQANSGARRAAVPGRRPGRERLRLRDRRRGPRRHEPARGRRRGRVPRALRRGRRADRGRAAGRRPVGRSRAAEGRPGGRRRGAAAARARRLRGPAAGRPGDRHRQPVRARGHGHQRHRVGARAARSPLPTTSRSPAPSRPTRRSTPATRAARCSTSRAA